MIVAEWDVILVGLVIRGRSPLEKMSSMKSAVFEWVSYLSRSKLKSPVKINLLLLLVISSIRSDIEERKMSTSHFGGVLGL